MKEMINHKNPNIFEVKIKVKINQRNRKVKNESKFLSKES